jgi:hypothetical protein
MEHQGRLAKSLERLGEWLDRIAESLFLIAFFLVCFKGFWALAGTFTMLALDVILSWPTFLRMSVGFLLIALPVGIATWFLFADEERPGWLKLAQLRKHPRAAVGLGLMRRGAAVVGAFAFLSYIWLLGRDGAGAIDWWQVIGELFGQL